MILRTGRSGDVRAMYELDLVCFAEPFRFDLRSIKRYVERPRAIVLVAETVAGGMAGFVIVHQDGSHGYVVTLDVHPAWRRTGVARQLMDLAFLRAQEAGVELIALHVFAGNGTAISFYERLQFIRTGTVADFYGPGLDACIYEKEVGKLTAGRQTLDEPEIGNDRVPTGRTSR